MKLGAVLMASGSGARFGGNKLLCPVDGAPMILRAFAAVPAGLFARACVVSCYPDILALAEARGYLAVPNPHAGQGQSASVRLGLSALEGMDGVLFSVCDQPWLRRESVERLLVDFAARPDHICALGFEGRRGNPAVFPRALFPELLALSGEEGGGKVIKAHPLLVCLTQAADPRELLDVDRPEDLFR